MVFSAVPCGVPPSDNALWSNGIPGGSAGNHDLAFLSCDQPAPPACIRDAAACRGSAGRKRTADRSDVRELSRRESLLAERDDVAPRKKAWLEAADAG
jgi:hypothetical protein